ncbi:MAG: ABC transporter substrate-binding protein [Oscillospiraceae bacterium]|jgi:ABC-type transport system substrate-binding protein|nr:ABC transporter substrate-binding protein [Oscillospiraceae bacterium]
MNIKYFALLVGLVLILLAGCSSSGTNGAEASALPTESAQSDEKTDETMVVLVKGLSGNFSPFTATLEGDVSVVDFVLGSKLVTYDASGAAVNSGVAECSSEYDEVADVTTYTIQLREGVKFSDGEELSADDVLFTYYTYLDPSFPVELGDLATLPIQGMSAYRAGIPNELYVKYLPIVEEIAANRNGATTGVNYNEVQYKAFYDSVKEAWIDSIRKLVDYELENYSSYAEIGQEITEANRVAAAMNIWGFGALTESGELKGTSTAKLWDLAEEFPTVEDYYAETYAAYSGSYSDFAAEKLAGVPGCATFEGLIGSYVKVLADEAGESGGVQTISGIRKLSDYGVEIVLNGYDESAAGRLFGVRILPLHYYGDESKVHRFGFDYGDTSFVHSTVEPMGAGPYRFTEFREGVAYLEANENYWEGEPNDKYVQVFEEPADGGTVDGSVAEEAPTDVESAVSQAIVERDRGSGPNENAFQTEAHVTLKTVESDSGVTVYAYALSVGYIFENGRLSMDSGSSMPVAITFERNADGAYILSEYWTPKDGSYYVESIHEKFPRELWNKTDTQLYVEECTIEALRKAQEHFGLTDVTKPEITVLKPLEFSVGAKPDWNEYFEITDDTDGAIPLSEASYWDAMVDFDAPGVYSWPLIVRDKAGNENRTSYEVVVRK